MRIDAHQHFWRLSNPYCNWPTPAEAEIYADFSPADIEPLLNANAIRGTLLVQAAPAFAETLSLLELAEQTPFVWGVVGWLDFESPSALTNLETLARRPLFRGLRPMLQSIPDREWVLNPAFSPILARLAELGLCFDALITPDHLETLAVLASRHPRLPVVIDHAAKPAIRDGEEAYRYWAPRIERLGAFSNVSCKLSGLLTEAGPGIGLSVLRPYLEHLYAVFGPDRLMWGSDWPVMLMRSDYAHWLSLCEEWLADKAPSARREIFGLTAQRIYGLTCFAGKEQRNHAAAGK